MYATKAGWNLEARSSKHEGDACTRVVDRLRPGARETPAPWIEARANTAIPGKAKGPPSFRTVECSIMPPSTSALTDVAALSIVVLVSARRRRGDPCRGQRRVLESPDRDAEQDE
mmetsp:Transcript_13107/g.22455  ORF Transcript_13107/g.22455 Transcript_13107/m.22455 type:complete len:115 (-) Transcript_13107:1388-1732(-)